MFRYGIVEPVNNTVVQIADVMAPADIELPRRPYVIVGPNPDLAEGWLFNPVTGQIAAPDDEDDGGEDNAQPDPDPEDPPPPDEEHDAGGEDNEQPETSARGR